MIKNQMLTLNGFDVKTVSCELHGDFDSRNIFGALWSKCPLCAKAHNQQQRTEEAKKAKAQRLVDWRAKVEKSGIPERFKTRSLDSYLAECDGQSAALAFAERYASDWQTVLKTGRSAMFCGLPGTGKTHLAVGIALRVMHREQATVQFTTVMRAIRRIKETWVRNSAQTESQVVAELVNPDLLILDEIGVQFGSDTEKLYLFDVLNERYENLKPTILLSNLPVSDTKGFLGERVFDRMIEGGGEYLSFDWPSYRKRSVP